MRRLVMAITVACIGMGLTVRLAMADNYGGNGYSLTVGLLMSEQALVSQALSMPSVQVAVSTCLARGYVREAAYDRGFQQVNTIGQSGSYVVLAFSRPNTPQAADTVNMPIIAVASAKAFPEDSIITYVYGTVMTFIQDASANEIRGYCSENAPGTPFAATDPSFVVNSEPGSPPDSDVATDWDTIQRWSWGKFWACEGAFHAGILVGAAQAGTFCGNPLTITGCAVLYTGAELLMGAVCSYYATQ